uniref:Large ribosomal subunit protein uL4c n=1 Tax=Tolypiocladia glomerulata TaxID=860646 RepID=A0A1Z1MUJ1_9FLOR|nr:ribosomal protein L4 [Tolypiocladia glomerulata]ARW69780.1 ribosomal protein L4 [Tolypiocladia glomerulata]
MNNKISLEYEIKNNEKGKAFINILVNNDKKTSTYLIHRALKQQLTNKRIRNAHTKTRSEVKGGGRKPWKQKGTGRARAGSNRSPLWRGGGIIFGPRKKIYRSKINKKEKRIAINTLIYNKFPHTTVIENFMQNCKRPHTKKAIQEINKLGIKISKGRKILVAVEKNNEIMYKSLRNIKNIELLEIQNINILSLLKADKIIITDRALQKLNYQT